MTTEQTRDELAQLEARWASGNSVPVTSIRITKDEWKTLRALLGAADGVDVPEGWKLVPLEVTAAMEDAGLKWLTNLQHMRKQDRRNAIALAYEAMVNATLTKAPAND